MSNNGEMCTPLVFTQVGKRDLGSLAIMSIAHNIGRERIAVARQGVEDLGHSLFNGQFGAGHAAPQWGVCPAAPQWGVRVVAPHRI
jgi:hypothetical protein